MTTQEMARRYRGGESTHQIAEAAGMSSWRVWHRLRDAGVRIRKRALAMAMARQARVDSTGYATWGKTRVHRIVAEAWHGPPPTSDHVVNHKDGDKLNNHPENLEWVTQAENARHAYEIGLTPKPPLHFGENQHCAKLTEEEVFQMRRLHLRGRTYASLGRRFGVATITAQRAVIGKTWKHVPFPDEQDPGQRGNAGPGPERSEATRASTPTAPNLGGPRG